MRGCQPCAGALEAHITGKGGGDGHWGFLTHMQAIWHLVMDRTDVQLLINEKESWSNVEATLLRVVDSSKIGRRLYCDRGNLLQAPEPRKNQSSSKVTKK